MLEPPGGVLQELDAMADWVEFSALLVEEGAVARDSAGETLDQAGLLGLFQTEYPPGEPSFLDADAFNPDDESDRYMELVWDVLRDRAVQWGDKYPFHLSRHLLERGLPTWRETPAYTLLLLLDLGRLYRNVAADIEPNTEQARLFEKVVEAAAKGVFSGPTCRFGWPREPGWPTQINDRIRRLGGELGLEVESLDGKTDPSDKDRGLDVVSSLGLGEPHHGTVWFLFQCACGTGWKAKAGEPSLADWQDVLVWQGRLAKVIAVPWRLSGLWDLRKTARKFDAVVLDRPRLVSGQPDDFLGEPARSEVITWCDDRLSQLPML